MDEVKKKVGCGLQAILAVAVTVVGSALLIAGFIVAPVGEVHNSVLIAFGEILTFAGALLGIDSRTRNAIEKMDKNNKKQEL